jgi:hypothetical protein
MKSTALALLLLLAALPACQQQPDEADRLSRELERLHQQQTETLHETRLRTLRTLVFALMAGGATVWLIRSHRGSRRRFIPARNTPHPPDHPSWPGDPPIRTTEGRVIEINTRTRPNPPHRPFRRRRNSPHWPPRRRLSRRPPPTS